MFIGHINRCYVDFYGCPTLSYGRAERRDGVVIRTSFWLWGSVFLFVDVFQLFFCFILSFCSFFSVSFAYFVCISFFFSSELDLRGFVLTRSPAVSFAYDPTRRESRAGYGGSDPLSSIRDPLSGDLLILSAAPTPSLTPSISSRTYINHRGPTTCTLFMTRAQLAKFSA